MAMDKDKDVLTVDPDNKLEESDAYGEIRSDVSEEEVAVVKTKKELKKERKELKKHKKEVKKDAKRHSAVMSKKEKFWLAVLKIFVIAAMVVSTVFILKAATGLKNGGGASNNNNNVNNNNSVSANVNGGSSNANSGEPATSSEPVEADINADITTKEGIVAYYKAVYAQALSNAKTATKYYDNTLNYNSVVEAGGNSTLESLAQKLMGMFMKEDKTEHPYSGADIASNLPPAGSGKVDDLTPDMLSDATCVTDGNNYIITLVVNSTEESYDTGAKTGCVAKIIDEKSVTDAAGSFVSLDGLENRYIGAKIVATVDQETGNLINLETDVPSYMCFAKATAMKIISVDNCRIGLEYQQKWKLEY